MSLNVSGNAANREPLGKFDIYAGTQGLSGKTYVAKLAKNLQEAGTLLNDRINQLILKRQAGESSQASSQERTRKYSDLSDDELSDHMSGLLLDNESIAPTDDESSSEGTSNKSSRRSSVTDQQQGSSASTRSSTPVPSEQRETVVQIAQNILQLAHSRFDRLIKPDPLVLLAEKNSIEKQLKILEEGLEIVEQASEEVAKEIYQTKWIKSDIRNELRSLLFKASLSVIHIKPEGTKKAEAPKPETRTRIRRFSPTTAAKMEEVDLVQNALRLARYKEQSLSEKMKSTIVSTGQRLKNTMKALGDEIYKELFFADEGSVKPLGTDGDLQEYDADFRRLSEMMDLTDEDFESKSAEEIKNLVDEAIQILKKVPANAGYDPNAHTIVIFTSGVNQPLDDSANYTANSFLTQFPALIKIYQEQLEKHVKRLIDAERVRKSEANVVLTQNKNLLKDLKSLEKDLSAPTLELQKLHLRLAAIYEQKMTPVAQITSPWSFAQALFGATRVPCLQKALTPEDWAKFEYLLKVTASTPASFHNLLAENEPLLRHMEQDLEALREALKNDSTASDEDVSERVEQLKAIQLQQDQMRAEIRETYSKVVSLIVEAFDIIERGLQAKDDADKFIIDGENRRHIKIQLADLKKPQYKGAKKLF